jgi:hypothetical protein
MPYPTTKVEIAFNDGPYVASPTWTNVTTYVREVSTRRGRNDDWQNFDTGTATVLLDNRTRIFDPTYTAGTYYGKLLPRRQIRITGTNASVDYIIFRGYVAGWPIEITEAGFDSTVSLDCFDALGLLANETLPYSWADTYIRSLNPYHYFPCDDPIDGSQPNSVALKDYGTSGGPSATNLAGRTDLLVQNGEKLAEGLPDISCALGNYNGKLEAATGKTTAATNFVSICGWYKQANLRDVEELLLVRAGWRTYVYYSKSSSKFLWFVLNNTTVYYAECALPVDTSQPHHIAWNVNSSGTVTEAWLDGRALTLTYPAPAVFATSYSDIAVIDSGVRQQYCVWAQSGSSALTGAQVATIFELSTNRITETTAARFTRLMAQSSYPSALYSVTSTPYATVSAITDRATELNNELQLLSDSEGGELYVSRSGILTMTNRYSFTTGRSYTSQATFGNGGIGIETQVRYRLDADNIRNKATVSMAGQSQINTSNTASIAAYGTASVDTTTQLSTVTDATNLSKVVVGIGQLPHIVIDPLVVNPEASSANWTTILGLDLMDRITVSIPQKVGSTLTQDQLIQQIEHTITPAQWTTRITGSQRYAAYFRINSSLINGDDVIVYTP